MSNVSTKQPAAPEKPENWLKKFSKKATTKPKDFGHPLRIVFNVLLIFLLSQIIAGFLVGLGLAATHHNTAAASDLLDQSAGAQFFYYLVAEGLAAGLVLLLLRRRGMAFAKIGLGRKPKWGDLKKALLGFAVFYGVLIVVSLVLTAVVPSINNGQQDVGFNSLNSFTDGILAFISLVILPPLGEEVLVRGYLYSGLRQRWKFVPAMLVTSAIFGAAHLLTGDSGLLWSAAVDTFVLSLVLVYLREKTGALYAGMLVHSLNNVIAFGVHFHGVMF